MLFLDYVLKYLKWKIRVCPQVIFAAVGCMIIITVIILKSMNICSQWVNIDVQKDY